VINSLLVEAADALGVPVPLALWLGWTLVLLPVMLLLRWLMRPVAWLLAGVLRLLRHFEPARA
jgi:CBS domain containing-hemolysin-like protein